MKISNASAIVAVNALTALFNVGGAGKIEYYDGTKPADADTAITSQNLLGTSTLAVTVFPTAVDSTGSATATSNAVPQVQVTAAGTVSWARAFDGNGLVVCDGNVALSAADFVVDDLSWEVDDNINVNSFTINLAE